MEVLGMQFSEGLAKAAVIAGLLFVLYLIVRIFFKKDLVTMLFSLFKPSTDVKKA